MTTGIYKIQNKINNKIYIGQSVNIERRWKDHRSSYKDENDHSYNTHLYRSMRKYGIENFDFSIIEICEPNQLNEKERYWIERYDSFFNGYNLTLGGDAQGTEENKHKVIGIINDLINTSDTQKVIAERWNLSEEMVQGINTGRYWRHNREEYPIRKQYRREQCYCSECGVKISFGAKKCVACENKSRQNVFSNEDREKLKNKIRTMSFTEIGREFGVSDNAIRKWCVKCNLPSTKKEINKYNDAEWELI